MRDCARSCDFVRALRVFRLPNYAKHARLLTAATAFHPSPLSTKARYLYRETHARMNLRVRKGGERT